MKIKFHPFTNLDYIGSRQASEKLAQEIRSYWRRRGREVSVWVEQELLSEVQGRRRYYYTVRSNLTKE